ncbi:serine hydrolase domain-containing protein [Natronoglomus mannanivorans]|uniref:Beta-lactamase family protein n=1 Tax=Natronoglomus mannanivorans TaxID=2979990 RepID=A0AAP3E3A1_9EURY|nr:beta-lactamase family protein [Halobacteria archaeon AArc-xg1-1]
MNEMVHRRALLRAGTVAGMAAIAGCSSDGTGPGGENATEAETEATETDAETETETETPTDDPDRPITGDSIPELQPLDDAMLEYMDDRSIEAGALGVSYDGEIVLERGYGWADEERGAPVEPDALFRIASLSKSFTDAAVETLVDDGRLATDERVSPLLEIEPAGGLGDERIEDITVQHLLDHEGGWNPSLTGDPMFRPFDIATELDLEEPPGKREIARYVLGQPLQFTPGEATVYSNFGYSLLGQVVEAVAEPDSYHSFLVGEVLEPIDVDDVHLARTHPDDRPEREVWYDDPTRCSNALELDSADRVRCADSGYRFEALDSAGGLVASTRALLEFMDAYWLTGEPRVREGDSSGEAPDAGSVNENDGENGTESTDDTEAAGSVGPFFGSLPGTFTVATQRGDGVDVVALFNRRYSNPQEIATDLEDAIDGISEWPPAE